MRTNLDDASQSPVPQISAFGSRSEPDATHDYEVRLRGEQRLGKGLIAGFVAALAGAALWAVITVVTNRQIGFMAVGVAVAVGWSLRRFGKGVDPIFGVTGAGLSLFGVVAGNLLFVSVVLAREYSVSVSDVIVAMLIHPGLSADLLVETFSPIDLLFYALALYYGFKLSFRQERIESPDAWTGGVRQ